MTKQEIAVFRILPLNLQQFCLKEINEGRYLDLRSIALQHQREVRKEDETRRLLALSTSSFVLITNNEKVRVAYNKLIEGKPNTDFNG